MITALLPLGAVPAASAASPGDIIINEIMQNPAAVSDSAGEWFELYNPTAADVDIDGWTISDLGSNTHTIDNGGPLLVPAGGYLVLGNNTDSTTNGGVDVAYSFGSSIAIGNADDEIILTDDTATEIDRVEYDGGTVWPDPTGASMSLRDPALDNNDGANWCTSITPFGDGDLGTPGAANVCPPPPAPDIIINEVDADTPGTDALEFVELYDGGTGNTPLDGLVVVFYNGNGDTSYDSFDLDGYSTDAAGYFVLGNSGVNPTPSIVFSDNHLQNGADAVALYSGDAADFPGGTAVTTANLIDAIVYDTNDDDAEGLLPLLNSGQPQVNEGGAGNSADDSNQRCPNGSGGARNTDTYAQYAPTPGAENTCTNPTEGHQFIYDIQGSGASSTFVGSVVEIQGVVTSDFQHDSLNGFGVEEVVGDGNAATSDGIFVYEGGNSVEVNVGDIVKVVGEVAEYNETTEITNVSLVELTGETATVTPTEVSLPWASLDEPERYEGMLVQFDQALSISEYFDYDRYGEIVLTDGRQYQPTAVYNPYFTDANDLAASNALGRITLDDNITYQNPDVLRHPNGEPFSLTNRFRGGDTVANLIGMMNDRYGDYRIQPTAGADYTAANPRPAAPDPVGGSLKVASFNVLNYFTTLDDGTNDICGPAQNLECRGADNPEEFTRQRDKIITAISQLDADVVGLIEIENYYDVADDVPLANLVDGLNAVMGAGTYAYVHTGPIGEDAIKVAFIYKPATVSLDGAYALLDSSVDSRFNDAKNRPALAQTFTQNSTGESVTVVLNHLKSKGSECGSGDDDPVQGHCNLTRTLAAEALVDWTASDPTSTGEDQVLIIGDLNSYDKEDPIDTLLDGGYTDLEHQFIGEYAYSYLFDGQLGYLDYGLANPALLPAVTGTTVWHINADEPDVLDYDTTYKSPGEVALYEPNAYRASDHDPVVIGLELDQVPPVVSAEFDTIYAGYISGLFEVDYSCVDADDPNPSCVGDINGIPIDDGQKVFLLNTRGRALHIQIGNILFIKDDSFLLTVTGTDAAGNAATATAEPEFRTKHHGRPGWR